LQDNWKINPKLTLIAGIRTINNKLTNSLYWEPRGAANYVFNKNISIKAAWGKYHQFTLQPASNPFNSGAMMSWVLADNKYYKTSFAEHRIIGFKYLNNDYLIDLEFYHKELKHIAAHYFDYLYSFNNDSVSLAENKNSGYSKGLDLLMQKKSGNLSGWISYGLNFSKMNRAYIGKKEYYPMDNDIRHNLKLIANYQLNKWLFSAVWVYASGKPYSTPKLIPEEGADNIYYEDTPDKLNDKRLPDSHHLNLSISFKFKYSFLSGSFGISAFNVYNRKNIWRRYFIVEKDKVKHYDLLAFGFRPSFIMNLKI
jgi:hypothetical protein